MRPANESPAPLAGGNRAGNSSGVTLVDCHKPHANATDFAALYIARRYQLPLPMAKIIAGLAQIGERLA